MRTKLYTASVIPARFNIMAARPNPHQKPPPNTTWVSQDNRFYDNNTYQPAQKTPSRYVMPSKMTQRPPEVHLPAYIHYLEQKIQDIRNKQNKTEQQHEEDQIIIHSLHHNIETLRQELRVAKTNQASQSDPWQVLGIPKSIPLTTKEDVENAYALLRHVYRMVSRAWHTDKWPEMPEEFKNLVEEKLKALGNAREKVLEIINEKGKRYNLEFSEHIVPCYTII